ncbi:type 2 isopentenyl-diphosphate Delta-isomerase [Bifidobacterium bombi]|uniref:Isopentenyl-diphosphate delta-isomerase n=1 Tax=Bifidobacterium bombi DSM 19703 TaxID=1341695 RepID=A0A080N3J9_9BIFI|nr:type 2 isopentenyl-diphosphate Delta-isomerase [Bifidobacterium bombi]KFF31586.1 putative isopentenyl pyrophosphate isomerase [Bifidobacterium bombi DSM 19703]
MDIDGNLSGQAIDRDTANGRNQVTDGDLPGETEARASGKLYVAGEYAVVEQGHPAILVGVDRWLTVRVSEVRQHEGASGLGVSVGVIGESADGGVRALSSRIGGTEGEVGSLPSKTIRVDGNENCVSTSADVWLGQSGSIRSGLRGVGAGVDLVGRIHSEGHPEASVTWRRRGGVAVPDLEQPGAAFVLAAIHAVEELAQTAGRTLRVYDVNITSELDDASGRKYGLGSSAAVTVATVKALVRFYGLDLTSMQLYKLAFSAASRAQKVGSGGDIAASLFGGCIRFTSVDRQWVTERLQGVPLAELIDMPWPGLSMARIDAFEGNSGVPSATVGSAGGLVDGREVDDRHEGHAPARASGGCAGARGGSLNNAPLKLLVGWTGNPASTSALVSQVKERSAAEHERLYREFLHASDVCVDALAEALVEGNMEVVSRCIGEARQLLKGLSDFTGTLIETPKLTELIDVAQAYGAAAKSSGAGGGDCGIAIVPALRGDASGANDNDGQSAEICREWRDRGILPLDLSVTAPQLRLDGWMAVRSRQANALSGAYAQGYGENRKNEHMRLALDQRRHEGRNAFDDIRFVHHSLDSISASEVDSSTRVCGRRWDFPLYVNAMTGGSSQAGEVNASLARVAAATGIALATGSQSSALHNPTLAETFTVIRRLDRTGFVFANIGPDAGVDEALAAVDMMHAEALQIHLNAVQETIMPEGSRSFSSWPDNIRHIVQASPVPVVIKEVGFGMSPRTVRQLADLGVRTVDVSGCGGTDFGVIENERRRLHEYAYMNGWGQSTPLCLLQLEDDRVGSGTMQGPAMADDAEGALFDERPALSKRAASGVGEKPLGTEPETQTDVSPVAVLASGGVRSALDVVKALALGAEAVGVSGHFLHTLDEHGEQSLIDEINAWKSQMISLMALLGARSVTDLRRTDLLVTADTAEEARLLGVDLKHFAHRSDMR